MAKSRSRFGCCFTSFLLMLVPVIGFGALLYVAGSGATHVENGSALEIHIDGPLREGPSRSPWAELLGNQDLSVWDVREALRAAATDSRISGVLLDIDGYQGGVGVVQELLEELDAFHASGKPIRAYLRGDVAGDGDYLLALGADEIFIAPATALMVNGFNAEVTFWRGTLDKLGIVPYSFMLKEYKSAGEPYSRTEMSDAFRESISAVLDDFMAFVLSTIAKRRGLDEQTVQNLVDRGMLTAAEALQARLVDRLGYRDALEQFFIDKGKLDEYHSIKPEDYVKALKSPTEPLPKIAVLFAEGPILASDEGGVDPFSPGSTRIHGPKLAEDLTEAAEDSSVKAIILRVNSPGGSPVGSDHIYRAIEKAQGRGKKVIVSMSDVAGSGGYWIAMRANGIVCQPGTITGSIGVVFQKFDLTGLYHLIGANISQVKRGENADLFSETTGLEGPRGERVLAWMNEIYETFKKKVAEGRGLSVDEVENIAKGRIWSGSDALERKLVDELGGMEEAVAMAKKQAGIADKQKVDVVVYPRPKNLLERIAAGELFSAETRTQLRMWIYGAQAPLPSLEDIREAAEPKVEVLAPTFRLR